MSDVDALSIEVGSGNWTTKYQEWVSEKEDLTKISAMLSKPILSYHDSESSTYFIIDGDVAYLYQESHKT